MGSLIERSPEARAWVDAAIAAQEGGKAYSRIAGSVVWSDARDSSGKVLLPIDPSDLVAKINVEPFPLLREHDPGRPIGKVLGAETFKTTDGQTFVAAILGFYDATVLHSFQALGLDPDISSPPPSELPPLPDNFRLLLAADPKEVESSWLELIARDAHVPIEIQERSHNSAEAAQQLVLIGVTFTVLVWNPFVKAFAEEAGKDAYKIARDGLKALIGRVGDLANPIVEIQSYQQGCTVSFMLRGKNVAQHYKAHALLQDAALRAHHLIATMLASNLRPTRLVYEFRLEDDLWAPSFVELEDGRLVSDTLILVAAETLPTGLSLGLTVESRPDE